MINFINLSTIYDDNESDFFIFLMKNAYFLTGEKL